jgi:hypothetical protein
MGSPDARFLAELQARRTAVQALPDHLATDPSGLAQGARLALQCAGLTWATGGDRGEVAGWLTEAARMGVALFRLAWRAEPPLAVPIAHRTTTLSGPVDASVAHVGRWLQLTSCAIVVRDAPSIALFAATPRAVLEGSASTGDRFLYPLAAALAGYCTGDPATADHLVAALELTDERSLRVLPAAQVQDLYVPVMNVLFELLGGDPGRVESALAQAFAIDLDQEVPPTVGVDLRLMRPVHADQRGRRRVRASAIKAKAAALPGSGTCGPPCPLLPQ